MKIRKKILSKLENVYAVSPIEIEGETHFIAAMEGRGRCLLFSPPDWNTSTIWEEPGGTMNVIPLRKSPITFLAIQKFFPIFKSERACIVLTEPETSITKPWKVTKVIDLPFVHRIDVVNVRNTLHLIASTLCGGKAFQDDWSRPGAVYECEIPEDPLGIWSVHPIFESISKNHGMHVTELNNRQVILVSGMEGVFMLTVPKTSGEQWSNQCLIKREVSDIYVSDMDIDGKEELITIEPFHGNKLVIYKLSEDEQWYPVFERRITFGHVVWAGKILGKPCVIFGCRGGDKELGLLFPKGKDLHDFDYVLIDQGVGPAAVSIVHKQGYEQILSANHGADEVALYDIMQN